MLGIECVDVTKVFNKGRPDEARVLGGVSVALLPGEITVLRGPSGSGKTTLLSIIGCMTRPTSGAVYLGDENVAKLPERFLARHHRSTFGFIFQQFNLIPEISVLENVMLPLYPEPIGFGKMRELASRALASVELTHRAGFKPRQLSGGEQQRVAVARALVGDPKVVLADEPTAHLDANLSATLLELFEKMRREGRSVVIATHDPLVHDHPMVDRIVTLRDGVVKGVETR